MGAVTLFTKNHRCTYCKLKVVRMMMIRMMIVILGEEQDYNRPIGIVSIVSS